MALHTLATTGQRGRTTAISCATFVVTPGFGTPRFCSCRWMPSFEGMTLGLENEIALRAGSPCATLYPNNSAKLAALKIRSA